MSNFGGITILSLARSIRTIRSSKACPYEIRELHITAARFIESASKNTTEDQAHAQSSGGGSKSQSRDTSSNYRDYHRRSYQRKKAFYERERNDDDDSKRQIMASSRANHYERLNLTPGADAATIKSAYYGLSKQYHPDIAGKDNQVAVEQFRLITESYDILSDPKMREDYDRSLDLEPMSAEWRPESSGNRRDDVNFNAIHRMRRAEEIFRSREEDAFEREKALNPRKFRAGSFRVADNELPSYHDRLEMMDRTLQNLDGKRFSQSASYDASEFYRSHLYDVIQRRKQELGTSRDTIEDMHVDNSALIVFFSVIASLVFVIGYNIIFTNYDWADSLDSYLDSRKQIDKEKDESQKPS